MSVPASNAGPGWDPLVRLTHWGIAAAVLLNATLTADAEALHQSLGYGIAALLSLRLIWGVIGPSEARFSSFPLSLSALRTHIGDLFAGRHMRHRSHNPAGAVMVYAIWSKLALVLSSGIALGPMGLEAAAGLHEAASTGLLSLVFLHLCGVFWERRRGDRGLIRRMISGPSREGRF